VPGSLSIGAPLATTLTALQSASLRAISFSVLDPLASAIGSTGSVVVQSGLSGFLNTLPPTAAGSADGLEPAAVGDTAGENTGAARIGPAQKRRGNRGCFDTQPLAQMNCAAGG